MPVILPPDTESAWLASRTSDDAAQELLQPFGDTAAVEVGPAVNDARYDGPELPRAGATAGPDAVLALRERRLLDDDRVERAFAGVGRRGRDAIHGASCRR